MVKYVTALVCFLFIVNVTLAQENGIYGRSNCENGKAGGIYPCKNVDMLSFIPISSLPTGGLGVEMSGNWGWTDSASKREFVLAGMSTGTAFVEITNPEKPIIVGFLPIPSTAKPNAWRELKVYKDYAFIVGDAASDHGVQIFSLKKLVTTSPSVSNVFKEDAHYSGVTTVHDVVINEDSGYMYLVGSASKSPVVCGRGLHVVDIRDPLNPKYVSCFAEVRTGRSKNGYIHDAQCVRYRGPDVRYQAKEICFSANETHLNIVDVTDKQNIQTLSIATHPNASYIHQGWLTPDQRYFFVNDELDEQGGLASKTRTLIYDVSSLTYPLFTREYLGPNSAIDHNLYIRGNYMFQGNYTAGMRIVDIKDPLNPVEVGFFDTYPANDSPVFEAVWNNYPFFASGSIALNSIGEGIFIVKAIAGVIRESELMVANEADVLPEGYAVEQNFPNPFSDKTTLRFTLPKTEQVTITLYDTLGRTVRQVWNATQPQGANAVEISAEDLPNGVYFYEFRTPTARQMKSLLISR